ncbi:MULTISPECIES: type II secretion system F family protein [Pseudoalteromonas]|uniref:type II secretion system F family protein n=1 Tax=Pseudoalteromonas TaxID=53246 RepID=UPI001582991F|nr:MULTISPECIES: type II secretion system F family protein [Pseudoalteromonas]MDI4652085.1 type II secretion system F family protein [Pseudoalteromonas shioyasakiensis]NUJ38410.1 type II secretion system F family protein [Pseudoalteromonas sp. 0303]
MQFTYKCISKAGNSIQGHIEAENTTSAIEKLKKDGLLVVSIKASKLNTSKLESGKVTLKDLEFLTSELSILLGNGIKLDKALKMLAKAKSHTAAGELINSLSNSISKGNSLHVAFSAYPQYFSPLYLNLLKIGEKTGELKKVFYELAKDLKFKAELKKRITQALVYPSAILCVCIASILFIFNFVVPSMSSIFEGRDTIPIYTEIILNLSNWLQNYQFYLIAIVFFLGYLLKVGYSNNKYRDLIQEIAFKLPFLGSLMIEVERVNFTSAVSLMLKSGLKIDQALLNATDSIQSLDLKRQIEFSIQELKRGNSLNNALASSDIFPDFYRSLIEVGEETAELDSVFTEIVSRSRNEFDSKIAQFLNLLEPVLILFMGLIVGGVVVTLMLSITSANDVGL